ncbi:MAG: D-alanine--D-alanine ligase [Verrucomicrobiaceae bacterium]|nr:D-alanine--D-alanine ligase [Verrucomicrobiaceae bacterium]
MSLIVDKHIAVLKGGPGSERLVSLKTAEGVAEALRSCGAKVSEIDVSGDSFEVPSDVLVAVNMIHGTYGEDGQLQAKLERDGIPYTGEGIETSRVAFDKALSKERFLSAGVPTPRSQNLKLDGVDQLTISLPVVVKPPREGSSVGVHICHTEEELEAALQDARRYGDTTLVEEYVSGWELTVGILGDQVLPIIRIMPVDGFYDINNKYPWMTGSGKSEYQCPAELPETSGELTARVQHAAKAAFAAIGGCVYGRVDVMLRESDWQPFVLEVNTIPGMTPTSLLPKACAQVGISYEQLCVRIIELSLKARPSGP